MTSGYLRAAARLLLAVTLAVAGLTVLAAPSSAHAALTGTDPKDGATLDALPAAVKLTFSDPLDPKFVRVRVTGPSGKGFAVVPTTKGQTVTLEPSDEGAGRYTVAYRVVSKDGHPVSGTLSFEVTDQAAPAQPEETAAPTSAPASTPSTSAAQPAPSSSAAADPAGSPTTVAAGSASVDEPSDGGGLSVVLLGGGAAALLLLAAGAWAAVRRRAG